MLGFFRGKGRFRRTAALCGAALLAAAVWLSGLTWGLPSRERLKELLPAARIDDPALHRKLSESYRRLYSQLEEHGRQPSDYITEPERIPGGWSTPPARLQNSYRSYFLRSANPDEQKTLTYLAAMKPRELEFEPFGPDYGGAFLYPLGAYYFALKTFGAVEATSDLTVYLRDVGKMARVFLAGRVFTVLGFAACACLLFLLGRDMGGPATAWTAVLLFILTPPVCSAAHTMNPYAWAAFWFLLGCRRMQVHARTGSRGAVIQAGAAAGLCTASSFAFITSWVPAMLPLLPGKDRALDRKESVFLAAAAVAACGAVFVAANPYIFLRFDRFVDQMAFTAGSNPLAFKPGVFLRFFTEFLPKNWGWLQTLGGTAAIAVTLFRKGSTRFERILALTFWISLLNLAGRISDFAHGRHFIPFFAIGSLLLSRTIWSLPARRLRALPWLLSAALLFDAGTITVSYAVNFYRCAHGGSTRMAAARWIDKNIPEGASVGLMQPPQYSETPPFRFDRHDIVLFDEPRLLDEKRLPDFVVANEARALGRYAPFFDSHYRVAAAFRPKRVFPWIPVEGMYSLANLEIAVLEKK